MFRCIVHGTDFSLPAMRALGHAVALAKRSRAQLAVVHAIALHAYEPALVPKGGPLLRLALERVESDLDERAGALLAPLLPTDAGRLILRRGIDGASLLLEAARERAADLVVVGARGAGRVRNLPLGSLAERVVRGAAWPVLVVGGDLDPPLRWHDVVVCVDFSEASGAAVALAAAAARFDGATLHAVHVFERVAPPPFCPETPRVDDELRACGDDALARFVEAHSGGLQATAHLREGRPAAEIAALADRIGADLVVLGAQGQSPFSPLALGSVANQVLRRAGRPVLVCPSGWTAQK